MFKSYKKDDNKGLLRESSGFKQIGKELQLLDHIPRPIYYYPIILQ